MVRQILSLVLSLALAVAGWILMDRFVMGRPWPEVYKGVAAVVVGFGVAHALAAWSQRRKRVAEKEPEDRT